MKLTTIKNYTEVLKPRATILLTFIGVASAFIAGDGHPPASKLLLSFVAILLATAGANGLTNYLDRKVDALMQRTKDRVLPSKKISPPEKVLPLTIVLVAVGLAIAGYLHPLAFVFGSIGITAALVFRKKATCVFPQGMLASCAPVLVGWFAIKPSFSWEIVILCVLIAFWLPLHVWSVMIANRDDYFNAGLKYFPMSREIRDAVKVLLIFSLVLGVSAVALYFVGNFRSIYLIAAILLSVLMIYASIKLVTSHASKDAWKLYKLSAFPYLGLIFIALVADVWLL